MSNSPLKRYVEPEVTDAHVARLWGRIEKRLDGAGGAGWSLRWRLAAALMAAAALVVSVGAWRWGQAGARFGGDESQTELLAGAPVRAEQQTSFVLKDASRVVLEPGSSVELSEEAPRGVRLLLHGGRVHFDVAPRPERAFVVVAGSVEVRVIGTRFSVESMGEAEGVRVVVERGSVEALDRAGGRPSVRLGAGAVWTNVSTAESNAPSSGAASSNVPATPEARGADEAKAGTLEDGTAAVEPAVKDRKASGLATLSAKDLLERASLERRAGDVAKAALSYGELLDRFPNDARAGLAALELARLRMDRLGDTAGAISALRRAIAQAPSASFKEDAMARLVQAYSTLGDEGACAKARAEYLASYPKGLHAPNVRARCPDKRELRQPTRPR